MKKPSKKSTHVRTKKASSIAKTRRAGNTKEIGSPTSKRKEAKISGSKLVSKSSQISKGRKVSDSRTNSGPKGTAKSSRGSGNDKGGTKNIRKAAAGKSEKSTSRKQRSSNKGAGVKVSKHFIKGADGKRKRIVLGKTKHGEDILGKGFQEAVEFKVKGNAKDAIEKASLEILQPLLEKNKVKVGKQKVPKLPRGVVIKFQRKYRGKKYYSGRISDITFVPTQKNIKKLITERIDEMEEDWMEFIEENAEDAINEEGKVKLSELSESGRALNPKNISMVSVQIVY